LARGECTFILPIGSAPVDRARNQIVEFFLKERIGKDKTPFTHLLMIDADTVPPPDALKRMLAHEKDIVSALTPILRYTPKDNSWQTYDNCFSHADRDENGKIVTTHVVVRRRGLQEIFRCGAACMLIRRTVFETIGMPYFQFITNEDNTQHVRSEDIDFCDRAIAAGFRLYADTDVVCGHYKDILL
jgi:GT2 family glycosyltransferase